MMTSEVKDTIANGVSISALGGLIMDSQAVLTLVLVLTGILLNLTRLYDWYRKK